MDGRMDEWVDEWMDGWMSGWMNVWIDGRADGQMCKGWQIVTPGFLESSLDARYQLGLRKQNRNAGQGDHKVPDSRLMFQVPLGCLTETSSLTRPQLCSFSFLQNLPSLCSPPQPMATSCSYFQTKLGNHSRVSSFFPDPTSNPSANPVCPAVSI